MTWKYNHMLMKYMNHMDDSLEDYPKNHFDYILQNYLETQERKYDDYDI
jgi:hypothetical protein